MHRFPILLLLVVRESTKVKREKWNVADWEVVELR